jgi:hypothetical protein
MMQTYTKFLKWQVCGLKLFSGIFLRLWQFNYGETKNIFKLKKMYKQSNISLINS